MKPGLLCRIECFTTKERPRWPQCSMPGCGAEAIARFELSAGCVARPGDREQDLCLHHTMRAEPLGSMKLLWDYTKDAQFSYVEGWVKSDPELGVLVLTATGEPWIPGIEE